MTESMPICQRLLGVQSIDETLLTKLANDRVVRLFYNCLYLGQWHLAVACLSVQQEDKQNDHSVILQTEDNIELILRQLIENPYCSR